MEGTPSCALSYPDKRKCNALRDCFTKRIALFVSIMIVEDIALQGGGFVTAQRTFPLFLFVPQARCDKRPTVTKPEASSWDRRW